MHMMLLRWHLSRKKLGGARTDAELLPRRPSFMHRVSAARRCGTHKKLGGARTDVELLPHRLSFMHRGSAARRWGTHKKLGGARTRGKLPSGGRSPPSAAVPRLRSL